MRTREEAAFGDLVEEGELGEGVLRSTLDRREQLAGLGRWQWLGG